MPTSLRHHTLTLSLVLIQYQPKCKQTIDQYVNISWTRSDRLTECADAQTTVTQL